MKILTTVINYMGSSVPYLRPVIDELSKMSDVVIFGTEEIEGYETIVFDKSVGEHLVFKNRQYLIDNIDNYDYFIYVEDDVFISNNSLTTLIELNERISKIDVRNNVGFLRYEIHNDTKYFDDLHPEHSIHMGGDGITDVIREIQVIDGLVCLRPWNHLSASYVLSRNQLKYLIDNNYFPTEPHTKYVYYLESGSSDINLYLNKVTPYDYIEELSTHHMSNKYIPQYGAPATQIDDIVREWKSKQKDNE
jgi:hypothetical protein